MTGTPLQRPRVSLSIGVAGKRDLEGQSASVEQRLAEILGGIAGEMDSIRTDASSNYLALRFDLEAQPRLTLVSGLADGADQVAARVFLNEAATHSGLEFLLGAILPCNPSDFVANSSVTDVATFERLLTAAAFTIELDGEMPATADAADPDSARRARAYSFRAQSAFLLRHSDLLIAVDSPASDAKIGGTQTTLRAARERGLPVILVEVDGSIRILRSPRDFDRPPPAADDLRRELRTLVRSLIGAAQPRDPRYVSDLLGEFFGDQVPPNSRAIRLWQRFEAIFRAPAAPTPDAAPGPRQGVQRTRASMLARHYAGMYRGTILIGYALAVVAVALAVGALVTLLLHPKAHAPDWEWFFLLFLTGLKLFVLIKIFRLIEDGNHRRLAHRAADFRYLSERLRAMVYLPFVASLRPPPQPSRPYCTRVESQGVIDRLFDAIVRGADPRGALPTGDGKTFRPDPRAAMEIASRYWLDEQIAYHQRNCETLASMSGSIEAAGRRMNKAVIGIVAIDLAIVLLFDLLPKPIGTTAHGPVALLLMSFAAVLPAAVASLNGIRFQTECTRISDRSAEMASQLEQLRSYLESLSGSLCLLDVLHAMEDIARLTLDEVAEWSGMFGKELVDP